VKEQSCSPHRRYLANPLSLKLQISSPLRLPSLRSLPRARYLAPPSNPRQSLHVSPDAAAHRCGCRARRGAAAAQVRANQGEGARRCDAQMGPDGGCERGAAAGRGRVLSVGRSVQRAHQRLRDRDLPGIFSHMLPSLLFFSLPLSSPSLRPWAVAGRRALRYLHCWRPRVHALESKVRSATQATTA
jgi:hypothetical protein